MKACHIYEIGAHKRIKATEERQAKLESLKLLWINDLGNLINLCDQCHQLFDSSHQLGIHLTGRAHLDSDEYTSKGWSHCPIKRVVHHNPWEEGSFRRKFHAP